MAVAVVAKHPVQRMSSPSRGFSALVHLFGLASFIGSFKLWVTRSFLYILHDDDRDLYLEWLLD